MIIKPIRTCLFVFIYTLMYTLSHGQSEPCRINPSFIPLVKKTLSENFNIPTADYVDNYKEILKDSKTKRSVVFHFFFDETNKFHKTAEDYISLLKDSIGNLKTDIQVHFKVQKTQGSIFFNDGENKQSIIHLNALVYSSDIDVIKDLFGKGKEVRIDTSSTNLKKFTHEFFSFETVKSEESGFLYLFRAKLVGKGFACDPSEDMNIIGILKNIYNKKFDKACEERMEEEAKIKLEQEMKMLNDTLGYYKTSYNNLRKAVSKPPKWTIFSNIDFLVGNVKESSSFINSELPFKGNGVSSTAGVNVFMSNALSSGVFLTTGLNVGNSSYTLSRLITHNYIKQENSYESISMLKDYSETIKSAMFNLPLGIGYQYRESGWPIYFQFSGGLILGGTKLTSTQSNGLIDYKRKYSELGDVLVEEQSALGLENDVQLSGSAACLSKTLMSFGLFANLRVNYSFSKNSPLSGFLNIGYNAVKVNTTSNESTFISTRLGEHNSVLNSISNLSSLPFQFGIGLAYDLRNVINPSKK